MADNFRAEASRGRERRKIARDLSLPPLGMRREPSNLHNICMAGRGGGEGEEAFAKFQKFQLKLYTVSNYVTLLENFVRVLFCVLWQMESQRQKGKGG